jgi:PAS domain S-box-containing protein
MAHSWTMNFDATPAAGLTVRRLLPVVLALALLIEGLKALALSLGLVRPELGGFLAELVYILMMVGLICWSSRRLAQSDRQRLRSEERFRTTFEQAPMGIALIDSLSGRILEVNRTYVDLVGWARDVLLTLDWMSITHPEDVQMDLDQMARLNAGEIHGFRMDKRLLREDGSVVWVRLTVAPVQVGRGQTRCHLAMIEDITRNRQAEEERQRLQAQLVQSQKLDSLGGLAGGVAHDMNNVLGAILVLASARLETPTLELETRQALETIVKAAERGGRMVKGLLSFARQTPVETHELNLNEALQEVARLLERTTLSKVRLELDLAGDLRPLLGDAGALTHAFMNLCVNALDAMPGVGTLTLRTRNVEPAAVEVQVEDTGAGMSEEVLDRCLDPFYTTKEVGKGTGLGLSLVYSTVKAHHGSLEIRSLPGQGTCVRIRFPASEPGGLAGGAPEWPPPESWPGVLKVLVVDDDELIRSALGGILKVLGYSASLAESGEAALDLLEAGLEPQVVILDMNMPGLGGSGTLPRLRSLRPGLPVLLATGRVDQTALNLVESDPDTLLLPKPFSISEIRAKMAAVTLRRGS